MTCEMSAPCYSVWVGVPILLPFAASYSCLLGGSKWWFKYLGSCHPCGKPRVSSRLLYLAWPSQDSCGHLESKARIEQSPSVCLCHSKICSVFTLTIVFSRSADFHKAIKLSLLWYYIVTIVCVCVLSIYFGIRHDISHVIVRPLNISS